MVVASVGKVERKEIITGENIKPGDPIIGLASSGLHSNGYHTGTENPLQAVGWKIPAKRHSRRIGQRSGS